MDGGDARESPCVIFDAPGHVRIGTRSIPPPARGQLRVRVVACGICHRDLHVISGRIARRLPDVMGHEPVGIVDAVGVDVTGFAVGQWVTGVGASSFSHYDLVEARHTASLSQPPQKPEQWLGEPAMCAVNAVNRIPRGVLGTVIVWGAGFMGNLLIQALRLKRSPERLVAVDIDPARLALALEMGADEVAQPDAATVRRLLGRTDLIFEASGVLGTIASCTRLVRNGGVLALFAHHFRVEPSAVCEWHLRGISVLNTVPWSAPNLRRELTEAIVALETGGLRMDRLIARTISMADAPTALCELASGGGRSRKSVVLLPWES